MSEQENLRVIREGFEAWNAHDVNAYTVLIDEEHIYRSPFPKVATTP